MKAKNILNTILFLFVLILLGFISWYLVKDRVEIKLIDNSSTSGDKNMPRDSGNENTPLQQEDNEEEIISAMKNLFSVKYKRPVSDVNFHISQRQGNYIVGGVKFAGEVAGGYVLGAKINGEWLIIFDGNGTIPCSSVDPIKFPSNLLTECWDVNTNDVEDRTVIPEFAPQQ